MSPEHTQLLYDEFPSLYREHIRSPPRLTTAYAFRCDDGWFELIRAASEAVWEHATKRDLDVVVIHVCEHGGSLDFRVRGGDREITALLLDVEYFSRGICQRCGDDNRAQEVRLDLDRCCMKCGFALWNPRFLRRGPPRDSFADGSSAYTKRRSCDAPEDDLAVVL